MQEIREAFAKDMAPLHELVRAAIRRGMAIRERTLPEREYVLSTVSLITYLAIFGEARIFPPGLQDYADFLNTLPEFANTVLAVAVVLSAAGVLDGAQRIAAERVPFLKAWFQVFILNQSFGIKEGDEAQN